MINIMNNINVTVQHYTNLVDNGDDDEGDSQTFCENHFLVKSSSS